MASEGRRGPQERGGQREIVDHQVTEDREERGERVVPKDRKEQLAPKGRREGRRDRKDRKGKKDLEQRQLNTTDISLFKTIFCYWPSK